jgi:hypothetical protein
MTRLNERFIKTTDLSGGFGPVLDKPHLSFGIRFHIDKMSWGILNDISEI